MSTDEPTNQPTDKSLGQDGTSASGVNDLRARELEYYKWRMSAFFENRMVHDKTILQLSSAGIGLIATLVTAFKNELTSCAGKFTLLSSATMFGITIWLVLKTFRLNSSSLISDDLKKQARISAQMRGVDKNVQWTFGLSIALLFLSCAILLFNIKDEQGEKMKKNIKEVTVIRPVDGSDVYKNSLDGHSTFNPAVMKPNTDSTQDKPSSGSSDGNATGGSSGQTSTKKE